MTKYLCNICKSYEESSESVPSICPDCGTTNGEWINQKTQQIKSAKLSSTSKATKSSRKKTISKTPTTPTIPVTRRKGINKTKIFILLIVIGLGLFYAGEYIIRPFRLALEDYHLLQQGSGSITYAGKTYNIVQIGDQTWFAENLNVGTKINSTTGGFQQSDNGTIEKYCYNNDEANCDRYGGLYEWTEAMQYTTIEGTQGICPDGWHIPTEGEYKTLETYVSDQSTKLIDENAKSGDSFTNKTGFSALFAGIRYYSSGDFSSLAISTYFWSSTENGSYASRMTLHYDYSNIVFDGSSKGYGFSIRCLKD